MRSHNLHRLAAVTGIVALFAGCDDHLTQPPGATDPAFTILDGARGGNTRFFFLPPWCRPRPTPAHSTQRNRRWCRHWMRI